MLGTSFIENNRFLSQITYNVKKIKTDNITLGKLMRYQIAV